MREMTNAYKILIGKPGEKRPFGSLRHRWEDIIKLYLRRIGSEGVDWINQFQDRGRWRALVNTVMNLRVPQQAENFLTI
jgi:hypothetical protein